MKPKAGKLIREDEVPKVALRESFTRSIALALCKRIPSGQAMEFTKEEIGVQAQSVGGIIRRLIKDKLISETFTVRSRSTQGVTRIYIINRAKMTTDEAQ